MEKDRISSMANYIIEQGEVTTEELARKFDVSIVTVRRDLNKLEKDNVIKKIYGGAKANSDKLKTFIQRRSLNPESKKHIVNIAKDYIKDGDRIFIDSGTTVEHILDLIDKNIHLTIFTNNLFIVNVASKMPNVNLFIVGNFYNSSSNSFTYWGKRTELYSFNIDKAFMCTSGFTIKDGLTNKNPIEQEIKSMVCKLADYIFLLVDDSKLGKTSLMTYAQVKDIDMIVTNKKPSQDYIDYFDSHNIKYKY